MNAHVTLTKALADYQFALNELMRPEEDVVLLSACYSVKNAFRGFLAGYLASRGVKHSPDENIESLMSKCVHEDINFLRFDLDKLNCKCDNGECSTPSYCMTFPQVKECVDLVSELGSFVVTNAEPGQ